MTDGNSIGKLILQGRTGWLYLIGCWTIVALFLSGHNMAIHLSMGRDFQIHHILLGQMYHYYFALLCPLIYRISFKFSFSQNRWILPLLIHLLMIAVMLLGLWWFSVLVTLIASPMSITLLASIQRQLKFSTVIYLTTACTVYYFIIFSLMTMIRLNRQKRLQEKKTRKLQLQASSLKHQLMQAKLQTLQMQLRPHFFFNSLNSISSLIQNNQNQLAYSTIARLGTLIRTTLDLPHNRTVPLSKEMDIINLYLAIEKIRFPDRLSTDEQVSKNCRNAQVPPFILQPLVENCIRHVVSIERKKVRIKISAEKNQSKLILQVSDNGPGLPDEWSIESNSGIGFKNLNERLKVIFKTDFEFKTISDKKKGLTVRLIIPYSLEPAKMAGEEKTV